MIIPAKIVISDISLAEATITGEFRFINQTEKWGQWWRDANGKSHVPDSPFTYNGAEFRLAKQTHNVVGIEIEEKGETVQSVLHLISINKDSTVAIWKCELPTGNNPVTRILKYRRAMELKKNMAGIMHNLTSYISDPRNVYGLTIHRTSTRDTTMLTASFSSPFYPTTSEIYGFLDILEKSIQKQNGIKTGYPMLNLKKLNNGSYETQVAIPTNRLLSNDGKIVFRRMVPGNFIVAEVKGGPFTINESVNQLEYFISDYNKVVMAKPFQQLITNRLKETDTSKWVTKLYIPVEK